MPIQFPPVNPGDDPPVDGQTYTYAPTQTEYIYNETENSWSIVAESGGVVPVIGVLKAGEGVTLTPADGDLAAGDVQITAAGSGAESFWRRDNGILSPTNDGDDLLLQDASGSAFLIDRFANIDDI